RVNLVHARAAVISLSATLAPGGPGAFTLTSLHYASPKPQPMKQIHRQAKTLIERWKPDV
nr:hypothetical protein [Acidobacteriota bacterium]